MTLDDLNKYMTVPLTEFDIRNGMFDVWINKYEQTWLSINIMGGEVQSITFNKARKVHREDGPARIYYGRNRTLKHEYYLDGRKVRRRDVDALIIANRVKCSS